MSPNDKASPEWSIRSARSGDEAALFALIGALSRYEGLEHAVVGSAAALGEHLFGPRPLAEALIAEDRGKALGFALFFATYSTFLTRPGIHLEDLFVLDEHRRRGIGRALLGDSTDRQRARRGPARVVGAELERERDRIPRRFHGSALFVMTLTSLWQ